MIKTPAMKPRLSARETEPPNLFPARPDTAYIAQKGSIFFR